MRQSLFFRIALFQFLRRIPPCPISSTIEPTDRFSPILRTQRGKNCARSCDGSWWRRFPVPERISRTGGHLASNLGAVELTVAIHRVFDTFADRLVYDVGHQCYPHKLLTGRSLENLRQFGGTAGFPKPEESLHDAFIAGHASNSVAVALGMARARTVLHEQYHVLAIIGDGALTGGLAYEGLSNAGASGEKLLVILNDNGMSIAPNVGAVASYLARQRLKPQYLAFKKNYRAFMKLTWIGRQIYKLTHQIKEMFRQSLLPCSMFEDMGFTYLGPVDGHDLPQLTRILHYAADLDGPVLLHIKTIKGKGYPPAEQTPDAFHGVSPFDPVTGTPLKKGGESFSSVFGNCLARLGERDDRVCAITAAMSGGTGLTQFQKVCPDRFFDVGIAEGCALSMASGMAKQGTIPVFAVYSTFLQRAYDMLLHDMAIEHLHVVLAVDRAGLVGEDGETHQGVFDVAFLDTVPGMTVLAPSSFTELEEMLEYAVLEMDGPVAVRIPRGGQGAYTKNSGMAPVVCLRPGRDITLISYGTEINDVLQAADLLAEQGVEAEILKLNTLTPLEPGRILESAARTGAVLIAEDSAEHGSAGERICSALAEAGLAVKAARADCGGFVRHGAVSRLKQELGLDGSGLTKRALEVLHRGSEKET